MITGWGYAPPIMPRHPPPSFWACSIRCMHRSMTTGLGKQLTIGLGQFVEPDSASCCHPSPPSLCCHLSESTHLHLCHRSSRLTSAVQRWQLCHVMRHEWSTRAMSLDKRGKVVQCPFLSRHLLHSLAHQVAQLAVEFSPTHPTLVVLPGGQPPPHFLLGSIESWHGVRGVPTHPRSSPLAQDSSWSQTVLRAATHPLPHSIATLPSWHASVSVTACHGSRVLSKDGTTWLMCIHSSCIS